MKSEKTKFIAALKAGCCQGYNSVFGDVRDGEMVLNEYGTIVQNEWMKSSEMRKNIDLDEFIIMPNHIHGIIIIVGAYCNVPLHDRFEKFGRSISKSIPTIIYSLYLFKNPSCNSATKIKSASV